MAKTRQQKRHESNLGHNSDSPHKLIVKQKMPKLNLVISLQKLYKNLYRNKSRGKSSSQSDMDQKTSMQEQIPYSADITPGIEGRVSKTKLTGSEKRASKQAHATLVAYLKTILHTI